MELRSVLGRGGLDMVWTSSCDGTSISLERESSHFDSGKIMWLVSGLLIKPYQTPPTGLKALLRGRNRIPIPA